MSMMCTILSPNCCSVTIFQYSSYDATLLPSCLSVLSEHVALQSKWQSADLDLLTLVKKRKSVWPALFRGNLCIWSDKISNVSAIHDLWICMNIYLPRGCFQNRPFYSWVLSYRAMNASEAGGDLALIQTSLIFSCKCKLVNIRTTWFA